MNNLLAAAYKYIENGICVIPVSKEKICCLKEWAPFQERMITRQELSEGFGLPFASRLAIVCGKTSGNLEVIDIDTKYDTTGLLFENYLKDVMDNDEQLVSDLFIIKTQSGGYHLYYRCEQIGPNQKLARRYANEDDLRKDPDTKVYVLIETRGQNGYVVAPPSDGYVKYSGKKIPTITIDQRDILLELARTYNEVIEPPKKEYKAPLQTGFFKTPWDDYNARGDVMALLKAHNWTQVKERGPRVQFRRPGKDKGISGDYHKDLRLFKVFTTSSEFEEGHGYTHYGIFKVLECGGDSSQAARKLLELGYGEKRISYGDKLEQEIYDKKKQGLGPQELGAYIVTNYPDQAGQADTIVSNLLDLWGGNYCTFWDINSKRQPVINRSRLIGFLHDHGGFALYYYDKNSTIFRVVQCKDGLLQEASTEYMKKFIIDYIESLPYTFDGGITPDDLKDLVLKSHDRLFSNGILEFLPRGEYNLLTDTVDTAYFPFRNGVVRVTRDKIELVSYTEIGRVVWKTQIIDFDIRVDPDIMDKDIEYVEFLNCIAGEDKEKIYYIMTLLGYLLHKYKDPAKPYCVILAEENDNEQKGGGTGKGIFLTALSKLINMERVDGKNFKLDKNFAFQRVGLDTRLIAIEDTRKNVDFEGFYSIITEGITVEKKNKDELFIPYKDAPKIVFTTNYTIINNGTHAKRRQKTFEFAPFFNAENTPAKLFGHNLFDDWDQVEWSLFYNLMFKCCSDYLEVGIQETGSTLKVRRKHIRIKYGEEFLDWFDDWEKNGAYSPARFTALHDEFLQETGQEKKYFSAKRFSQAIKESAEMILKEPAELVKKKSSGPGRPLEISLKKVVLDVFEKESNVLDPETKSESPTYHDKTIF